MLSANGIFFPTKATRWNQNCRTGNRRKRCIISGFHLRYILEQEQRFYVRNAMFLQVGLYILRIFCVSGEVEHVHHVPILNNHNRLGTSAKHREKQRVSLHAEHANLYHSQNGKLSAEQTAQQLFPWQIAPNQKDDQRQPQQQHREGFPRIGEPQRQRFLQPKHGFRHPFTTDHCHSGEKGCQYAARENSQNRAN